MNVRIICLLLGKYKWNYIQFGTSFFANEFLLIVTKLML